MITQISANNTSLKLPNEISLEVLNNDQLTSQAIKPIRLNTQNSLLLDSQIQLLDTSVKSWLNSIHENTYAIGETLRSTSFFDLLHETPTIKQLFTTDFKNLVDELIIAQETELELNKKNNFQTANLFGTAQLDSSEKINKFGELNNITEIGNLSNNAQLNNLDLSVNYNHLLLQQNPKNINSGSTKDTEPKRRQTSQGSETNAKPYNENNKENKKRPSLSQKLIKTAIKNLNNLVKSLSKYA